ncbi:MAG: hypothetical protein HC853_06590 [Anaerolineae bacterium]|nr:hypothetical protein [Anaerolineae bacterium]
MDIRRATLADLEVLNVVAFLAKAHWGYPPEWVAAWQAGLACKSRQSKCGWMIYGCGLRGRFRCLS